MLKRCLEGWPRPPIATPSHRDALLGVREGYDMVQPSFKVASLVTMGMPSRT